VPERLDGFRVKLSPERVVCADHQLFVSRRMEPQRIDLLRDQQLPRDGHVFVRRWVQPERLDMQPSRHRHAVGIVLLPKRMDGSGLELRAKLLVFDIIADVLSGRFADHDEIHLSHRNLANLVSRKQWPWLLGVPRLVVRLWKYCE
jgi:hypothetical protein